MTIDLWALVPTLLSNFVTLRFPMTEQVWTFLNRGLSADAYARCLDDALRHERLLVGCHRFAVRQGLHDHGYHRFLDRVEGELGGDWRIHLFLADEPAMQLLPSLTPLKIGPGDPVNLRPTAFIDWRLRCIENLHRLTGRYEWLLDDLP